VIVSELEPNKREMAQRLGATHVVDPRADDLREPISEATGGMLADTVIECVGGEETAQQAVSLVGEGGTALLFGVAPEAARISVSPYDIYRRELTITGSFTNPFAFDAALALLRSGRLKVDGLVSHQLPLSEVVEGIELLRSHQALKVVIEPQRG
jgi:threonine dehydrogenase-like Zn-dependent dehydrogenase